MGCFQCSAMKLTRRKVLGGVGGAIGIGVGAWVLRPLLCNVACFTFVYEPFDDAPGYLTIRHTGGRDLSADEVFITGTEAGAESFENVNSFYEPDGDVMKSWADFDSDPDPTDGIAGDEIRIDFGPELSSNDVAFTVLVLWKTDEETRTVGEWVYNE